MKTAVIRQRVADFLKQHPPFDSLPDLDLLALAGSGRVKFHESDEFIFRQQDRPGPLLFVIQQGRVEVLDESPTGARLRDVLGAGDLLGFDYLPEGGHRHSARTAGDVILYAIDAALFDALADAHPAIARYLAAHVSAASSGVERPSWLDAEPPPPAFTGSAEPLTTRDAVRAMLASDTDTLGALTAADLAFFCDHNPPALRQRIRGSRTAAELGPLLECARRYVLDALGTPADADDAALLGSAFTRAALEAAARIAHDELAEAGMEAPAADFCWLAFGPAARGELLRPALPNLAVLYDDASGPEAAPWFAALAGQTIACLTEAGLHGPGLTWPRGAQPSMPLAEWKRFYTETVTDPIGAGLYQRREFFDVAPLTGLPALARALQDHIAAELAGSAHAVPLLANDTLCHLPPLTLFRGLVLQLDGAETERFDLRKTVTDPIADAARVFGLVHADNHAGTLERLAHAGPEAVFRDAADAFRAALYFEALAGAPTLDAGHLGRYDQRLLKTVFDAVQRLLEHTIATF